MALVHPEPPSLPPLAGRRALGRPPAPFLDAPLHATRPRGRLEQDWPTVRQEAETCRRTGMKYRADTKAGASHVTGLPRSSPPRVSPRRRPGRRRHYPQERPAFVVARVRGSDVASPSRALHSMRERSLTQDRVSPAVRPDTSAHLGVVDRRILGRDRSDSPALPRLRESPMCLLAGRSAAACKRTRAVARVGGAATSADAPVATGWDEERYRFAPARSMAARRLLLLGCRSPLGLTADCRFARLFATSLQAPDTRIWRMGGARRRAGRGSLSLPHGYHARGAVAGCVRKRQRLPGQSLVASWLVCEPSRRVATPHRVGARRRIRSCAAAQIGSTRGYRFVANSIVSSATFSRPKR
jgi:hypothetical protein